MRDGLFPDLPRSYPVSRPSETILPPGPLPSFSWKAQEDSPVSPAKQMKAELSPSMGLPGIDIPSIVLYFAQTLILVNLILVRLVGFSVISWNQ